MNERPNCPNCNSNFTIKSEKSQGRQRYYCKNCDRYFIICEPQPVDVVSTPVDSDLDSSRKEVGISLLGISLGFLTAAFLFLSICGLLFLFQFDINLQPKLPNHEKRLTHELILLEQTRQAHKRMNSE